jgi:putative tryptophan/tyrosine transport system substrate-binding protein
MRRREFIKVIAGSAAAWSLPASAQQRPMPVVGFLNVESSEGYQPMAAAFRRGLQESGYVEGQNVTIEYRWADGHGERLPELAADLAQKHVTVIAATSTPAAIAAKATTTTVPIVFETASDPVRLGLVDSLSRPGGNVTGVTQTNVEIAPKRLEVMHELLPNAKVLGLLINPADPSLAEPQLKDFQAAAHSLGVELHVVNVRTDSELEKTFADLDDLHVGGVIISTDPFFTSRPQQLASLTARYAMPAVSKGREFAAAGGLLSYGADTLDTYRLTGVYTGRVLKGEKPADLPVQQATKVELYINLKTAKKLGITVPLPMSGRADEVFE